MRDKVIHIDTKTHKMAKEHCKSHKIDMSVWIARIIRAKIQNIPMPIITRTNKENNKKEDPLGILADSETQEILKKKTIEEELIEKEYNPWTAPPFWEIKK